MDENTKATVEKKAEKAAKPKTKKEKAPSFEEALTRLEEIASLLEDSNPPLDTALSLYEESAGLLKLCTSLLDEATQKITVLEKDS